MLSAKQLANRLREAILNGTWIANTNFKQELTGALSHGINKFGLL